MACYSPLHGWVARRVSPNGKRAIVFNVRDGFVDLPTSVPCGQCVGCRLERSRQWAVRCMHEASQHDENCFVTLTYDDANLPDWDSLDRSAFPKFMKRLRKRERGKRIRYFHAGEYGDRTRRPHYHACLFGHDFADKVYLTSRSGNPVYISKALSELWPFGLHEIGSVTFESAAYVARYVCKKVTGPLADAEYEIVDPETGEVGRREPEYATMSRRPGIGKDWLDTFRCEVYPADGVVVRGRLVKPPRFYDMVHEAVNPDEMAAVRRARRRSRNRADETDERLEVRRGVAEARLNLHGRNKV